MLDDTDSGWYARADIEALDGDEVCVSGEQGEDICLEVVSKRDRPCPDCGMIKILDVYLTTEQAAQLAAELTRRIG